MIKVYDKNDNEIATGSGFCAFNENYIVTNYHVIEGAYKINIVDDEMFTHSVKNILIYNQANDLAILECDYSFTPIAIGEVDGLKAGDKVTAIGSPEGQLKVY